MSFRSRECRVRDGVLTELLGQAIGCVRALPSQTQDDLARVLLRLAGDEDEQGIYILTPAEKASLAESMRQAERGEFATDEEVRAIWAKHDF